MKLIVADSGPLIALACSGHIDVLLAIVPQVMIPQTVFLECTTDMALPGAEAIDSAVATGKIQKIPDPVLGAFKDLLNVDPGEAAVLALALEQRAAVLMDDAAGREIAKANGIHLVGACGILLRAKQLGLVQDVAPIIQTWKSEIGYHLSGPFMAEVLHRAGEL